MKTVLIGGVNDGKVVNIPADASYWLMPTSVFTGINLSNYAPSFKSEHYIRRTIHCDSSTVPLMIHESLTMLHALERLVGKYGKEQS